MRSNLCADRDFQGSGEFIFSKIIPERNGMKKDEYRSLLIKEYGVAPGSPAYLSCVKEFMPLEIVIGESIKKEKASWWPCADVNGFLMLLGSSGSGKTEALKMMGSQILNQAIPVLALDFHGDIEFPYLNSVLLSSGHESVWGISPLEIDGMNPGKQGLREHYLMIVEMLHRAAPSLGMKQRDILLHAIEAAYVMVGIEEFNPRSWLKTPPSFRMVADVLSGWASNSEMKPYHQSITGCLIALNSIFGHPVFNRINNIKAGAILASNLRFDLSHLSEPLQALVAETILRMVYRALRARGPISNGCHDWERFRLFILIDEAKILAMGFGDPDKRSSILNVLATEGRKFGIGLILASQTSSHFGRDVKRNFASRLILKASDYTDARLNAADIRITPNDLLELPGHGAGYLCTGRSDVERIQVVL